MSEFIQFHMLAAYPPSNVNRDDLGRPKTAMVGGCLRLRISSQSLKRAWRTSDTFSASLKGTIGIRTREMGVKIQKALTEGRSLGTIVSGELGEAIRPVLDEKKAKEWAIKIASHFGALEKDSPKGKQMVHYSQEEITGIDELLGRIASEENVTDDECVKLRKDHKAVDIALFGRMLADSPEYNTDAAVQVSHAITVHKTLVEDDYFTAVDDLNTREETGAGHVGDAEFGAGLFYTYICINRDLLIENLQGDATLADKAIQALIQASATVSPSGKQNSFASRTYALYILAEKGSMQPRSLASAFFSPVAGENVISDAISALEKHRDRLDAAYGTRFGEQSKVMNIMEGSGTLADLLTLALKS